MLKNRLFLVGAARYPGWSNIDENFVAFDAHRVGMESLWGRVCHTLAAGAVETPMVVRTIDDCSVELRIVKRHARRDAEFLIKWKKSINARNSKMGRGGARPGACRDHHKRQHDEEAAGVYVFLSIDGAR